jgi:hypothetical protein
MRLVVLLAVAVVCVALVAVGGGAAASAPCRIIVVKQAPRSIVMHKCDRVRVQLHYGGQGDPPYEWGVSHGPSPKILTLIHGGFWRTDPNEPAADQYWTYRARAKGRTFITFGAYTTSFPDAGPLETFKLSVTVR